MNKVEKLICKIVDVRNGTLVLTEEAKANGVTTHSVLNRLKSETIKEIAYIYRKRFGEALPTSDYREACIIYNKQLQ